jgi:uncharacterized protein (TIGR00288 family)
MGIRSDLTKELKNLLNSDIIKGKVAVQRAYADWRRYPQYIVPLAESSVDLIFAPAYGSAKKNATDIRLAIDAVELVFTRPEIGTIILLSGDSDFSSLVLKLKEYGKYVIGVGIRESASDLLVQNCDEYYSYSALTGLTRAGDEAPVISEDPWELVEMALRQMIDNGDVMRSDRLKQVLIEMDPAFDEKALGFQKFNKFLQEAAGRGIISVRKQENGQYEVGPPGPEAVEAAAAAARGEGVRETRSRRGRRGRGRRDEQRLPREEQEPQLELEGADAGEAEEELVRAAEAEAVQPAEVEAAGVAEEAVEEAAAPAARERRPRRGRGRKEVAAQAEEESQPEAEAAEPAAAESAGVEPAAAHPAAAQTAAAQTAAAHGGAGAKALSAAYDLLRRAVNELVRKSGPAVRDSDVKRRMLELQQGWDESEVGFSKFSRFLRQAHDAQVITLRKGDNGNDVLLGDGGVHVEEPRSERGGRDGGRGRGGRGRDRDTRGDWAQEAGAERTVAAAGAGTDVAAGATQATPAAQSQPEQKLPAQQGTQPERKPDAPAAPAAGLAMGFRRGSRGRAAPSGPPPLLEGQTVLKTPAAAAPSQPAPGDVDASEQPATPAARTAEDTRAPAPAPAKQPGRKIAKSPAKQAARAPDGKAGRAPAKQTAGAAAKAERPAAAAKKGARPSSKLELGAFGLPTSADAVTAYLSENYKGVGPKSVEALLERVGPAGVFDALENQPDMVREVVGGARGERLLEAWADDIAFRRANAAPTSAAKRPEPARPPRRGDKSGAPSRGPAKGGAGKGRPARRGPSSRK